MTDYVYSKVAVYAELGGALRLARNARSFATDPVTAAPVNVTQGAFTAPYLDTDSTGIADFTATTPGPIRLTTGATFVDVYSDELPGLALAAIPIVAASAASAALSASLVGAPADTAVAAIVGNPASATRVSLGSTYAPLARTNLAINPNMETNITNWTAAGGAAPATITRDTTIFHSGAASLKAVCSGASIYQGVTSTASVMAALVVGQTYTVSAWVYSTVAGLVRVGLTSTTPTVLQTTVSANTWTRVSYTGVANSATLPLALVDTGNVARATTLYIDDVLVEQSATVNTYFDGSTTDTSTTTHAWTGSTNASKSRETPSTVKSAAITTPTAPSATYVQAEAAAMKTAVDAIRATLTANGFSL